MMSLELLSRGNDLPVTPSELRVFMNLDTSILDTELVPYIISAADLFEKFTGHATTQKQYQAVYNASLRGIYDLPHYPIINLVSVYADTDVISPDSYVITGERITLYDDFDDMIIKIIYNTGYTNMNNISPAIKRIVMMCVCDLYFYGHSNDMSNGVKTMMNLYKKITL
jgi:hypothetical protein